MHRQVLVTTVLVVVAMGVMIRLGVWQLDRLAQRRAFNANATSRLQAPPLTDLPGASRDLAGLHYRAIVLRGRYDFTQQVALNNQEWQAQPGVHLITPLVLADSPQAVLVDRGWIPYAESAPANWEKFAEPGVVEVRGRILSTQTSPLAVAPVSGRQDTWFRVDVAGLQNQVSHPLLPVYVQALPDPTWKNLPYRRDVNLDLSEGPHLGYAITWFSFAAILGIGSGGYALGKRFALFPIRPLVLRVSK